jgi:hypothetical protein
MTIASDNHKWHLYYRCNIALAQAWVLSLASIINYDHKLETNSSIIIAYKWGEF